MSYAVAERTAALPLVPPRCLSRPEAASSAGPEAVELARTAGLVLLPWQELVLEAALAETAEGFCASFEVGLVVPRQNGKGGVLEAAELYWLFLDDAVDLITHTAHRFDTSLEHFTRIRTLVETTPELMAEVKGIYDSNGKERIELRNGKRLQFKARSKGGGRGFSGDRVVLDEAYYINDLGSLLPTMSARPDPQLWWTSSAPLEVVESDALRRIIARGRAGEITYAEWSADVAPSDLDAVTRALDDRDAWAEANPSLGSLITEEFIGTVERSNLTDAEFARERLGIFPDPDNGLGPQWSVIAEADWSSCRSGESGRRAGRPGWLAGDVDLAVEVRPDRSSSSVAVAGECREGGIGVDVVATGAGTGWVVAEVAALVADGSRRVRRVVIDEAGPAAALIGDLEAAGVTVTRVAFAALKLATAGFFDAVVDGEVVHRDRPELTAAVSRAEKRKAGDALLVDRRGDHDMSSLVAALLAHHAVTSMTDIDVTLNVH